MTETGETPDGTLYVLEELTDNHVDDYALHIGAVYIEFSTVQWADYVLLLLSADGGGYVSLNHNIRGRDYQIGDELYDKLLELDDERRTTTTPG